MTRHRNDHATHDLITTVVDTEAMDAAEHRSRAAGRVAAGIGEIEAQLHAIIAAPRSTGVDRDAGLAERSRRLAVGHARLAGWWGVLIVSDRAASSMSVYPALVYRVAVHHAQELARDQARFWRDTAEDWQARADGRPTSDAAGALSNWHELGVTS